MFTLTGNQREKLRRSRYDKVVGIYENDILLVKSKDNVLSYITPDGKRRRASLEITEAYFRKKEIFDQLSLR